jgi:hypothetical protein
MIEIETVLDKKEEVTPKRFLSVLRERKDDIERVSIRPPRLGGHGFGRVVVEYKHGVFRPALRYTGRK